MYSRPAEFFLISGFLFTNLPLPQAFLERRKVATKERKKEIACIVSKPLVSCLWGCGESVNPPKLNIQEVQGALSSRPKGDPGPLPIFQDFLLLSNHTTGTHLISCRFCHPLLDVSLMQLPVFSVSSFSWPYSSHICCNVISPSSSLPSSPPVY